MNNKIPHANVARLYSVNNHFFFFLNLSSSSITDSGLGASSLFSPLNVINVFHCRRKKWSAMSTICLPPERLYQWRNGGWQKRAPGVHVRLNIPRTMDNILCAFEGRAVRKPIASTKLARGNGNS